MDLQGWNIDIASLPFPRPDRVHTLPCRLYENPSGRLCALLYCVNEYRMCTCIGRLVVFEDRHSPRPIFESPDVWWYAGGGLPSPSVITWVSEDAFVVGTAAGNELPLVVIDTSSRRFCFVHAQGDIDFQVQFQDGLLSLSPLSNDDTPLNQRQHSYSDLLWFPWEAFAEFFQAYATSARHYGIPIKPPRRWWAFVRNAFEGATFVLICWPLFAIGWLIRQVKKIHR